MTLSVEQSEAVAKIMEWLDQDDLDSQKYFCLYGPAGTGKTYCVQEVLRKAKCKVALTAPTNKATRVLKMATQALSGGNTYRTIYSLLGLTLSKDGEVKELVTPEEPLDISQFGLIIIDEVSMVNQALWDYIEMLPDGVKVLLLGDFSQLPPVGEAKSKVYTILDKIASCRLTSVRRNEGPILGLVNSIRTAYESGASTPLILETDLNKDRLGVLKARYTTDIESLFTQENFLVADRMKIVAWRNITVDKWNETVRKYIWGGKAADLWLPEDRITLLTPVMDSVDGKGITVGTIDDEGRIERIEVTSHPKLEDFTIFRISVNLDYGRTVHLKVLHPASQSRYLAKLDELKKAAMRNGREWRQYWGFVESFDSIRHAYATTAHKSQGSTYDTAIVCWRDILMNHNRTEAYRCMYVACSRAKKHLILI